MTLAALKPRLQLITPAGGVFRVEGGAWVGRSASDAPPKPGDVVEIKAIVTHAMENGYRKGKDGALVPRNLIDVFTASLAGQEVFRAELGPGVSANPYIAFFMRIGGPGEIEFKWHDDTGGEVVERVALPVASS